MSIELVMPSNHLILCRLLILPPSIFPSIRVFSNESILHIRWPKYWSFSFTIGPSSEYSGLISFTIDWFALLAVQGTLKSLLHHSSKTSILWHSAFFMVQLSYPYMTTGKTIALTRWTFVGKVMSLLFIYLFYFTILYWFCHTLTWIRHGCTCVPHPEPPAHLINGSLYLLTSFTHFTHPLPAASSNHQSVLCYLFFLRFHRWEDVVSIFLWIHFTQYPLGPSTLSLMAKIHSFYD